MKPYEKLLNSQLELYSSHHPEIAFDFITNEVKDKFSSTLLDLKVDKPNHKLVAILKGSSSDSTERVLKIKLQFMQFKEGQFCIQVTRLQGDFNEFLKQFRDLKRIMAPVVLQAEVGSESSESVPTE